MYTLARSLQKSIVTLEGRRAVAAIMSAPDDLGVNAPAARSLFNLFPRVLGAMRAKARIMFFFFFFRALQTFALYSKLKPRGEREGYVYL